MIAFLESNQDLLLARIKWLSICAEPFLKGAVIT